MKQMNKKLVLKKYNLIQLNPDVMQAVRAGDEVLVAPRETYLCAPPYNAPPYFYPNTRNECVVTNQ